MKLPLPFQLMTFGLLALMLVALNAAFPAGINVSSSKVGGRYVPTTAEDIKPPACAALRLNNIVRGNGTMTGTNGNDLIISGSGSDVIDGLGGDDCILGGGGDDTIIGNAGTDICIGGPGTDTFTTCEHKNQ